MRINPVLLVTLTSACIDPLVSDLVERPSLILPAGAVVHDLLDVEPTRRAGLAANDGVPDDSSVVSIRTAFADGKTVRFWDLGPVSPTPIPLYLLVSESDTPVFETPRGGFSPIGHLPIFDSIPGDLGYSPFWSVVLVPVTAAYDGEILASFDAVDEAVRLGLAATPIPVPLAINCPVVLPEARLERRNGDLSVPSTAYYKGTIIHYFDFDAVGIDPNSGIVAAPPVYELRREGGEPISELIRRVDFTGSGDLADTNDLFEHANGSTGYTGLVSPIETIVAAHLDTLDITRTLGESDLSAASDLFIDGAPNPDVVIAMYPRGTVINRPIARPPTETESE